MHLFIYFIGVHWLKNYTSFRCTIPQHIFCILYCVFTTEVFSFHHHLSPIYPPSVLPLSPPPSLPKQSPHCCLCPLVFFSLFYKLLFHPSTSPAPNPSHPWESSVCTLSLSLSLCCLLVHFVH